MLDVLGLLRRNGVGCLLGLDARPTPCQLDGPVVGIDAVLENRVLFGSVNAHPGTGRARSRRSRRSAPLARRARRDGRPRVAPDRFAEAFAFGGVKATLVFG